MVRKQGRKQDAINLCSNNYLGLADHEKVVNAGIEAAQAYGTGMASVRFICGTHELHLELESEIARYVGQENAVLFGSAFDANGGVFEALLGEEDAIVSDSLNHASIIDGVRLCKAKRFRYANCDMNGLEAALQAARQANARTVLIVTDGVFSMDGIIAPLAAITDLAEKYNAAVMVDDCHAHGILGQGGRGTPFMDAAPIRVDLVSGTLGKALGGSMGGFIAGEASVIETIRARARPYLFSNALPPFICAAALAALRIAASAEGDDLRTRLFQRTRQWRDGLSTRGFRILGSTHPITPVMMESEDMAFDFADALARDGIVASAFAFPVVPKGLARIRVQPSAAHTAEDITQALEAFVQARQSLSILDHSRGEERT